MAEATLTETGAYGRMSGPGMECLSQWVFSRFGFMGADDNCIKPYSSSRSSVSNSVAYSLGNRFKEQNGTVLAKERILAATISHLKYSLPLGPRLSHAETKRHFRPQAPVEVPILSQVYRPSTFTEAALPNPTYTRLRDRETLKTYPYRAPAKHED